jgi:hypothetical protein
MNLNTPLFTIIKNGRVKASDLYFTGLENVFLIGKYWPKGFKILFLEIKTVRL